ELLAGGRVPDAGRPVPTGGDHPRPVRAEPRGADIAGVPLEFGQLLARRRVPDAGHVVATAGDDLRPVRAERRVADAVAGGGRDGRIHEVGGPRGERYQVGVAEAVDVVVLPAAQVRTGAGEQGAGLRDLVVAPRLVGHLDRPPVVDPDDLLLRLCQLGAGLVGGIPLGL